MSALKQITTRAKIIRRSQGGSWKSAIKKASAEYRSKSKKVSAVKFIEKKEKRSTRPARIVKITRKKDGTFKKFSTVGNTGGAHNEMLLRNLSERNRAMITAESRLIGLKKLLQVTPKGIDHNKVKGYIKDQKKYMRVVKTEIRMLKSLIK